MLRSVAKFPTYRRKFRQIVKALIIYSIAKEGSTKPIAYPAIKDGSMRSSSVRSVASVEIV